MDFESAQNFLESFINYERVGLPKSLDKDFDLERIKGFLVAVGVDYQSLKYIHVAGSKGKGSVCSLISAYLNEAGFKVGLYTSPHIVDVRERIVLEGEMISHEDFVLLVEWLKRALDDVDGKYSLTYFELLTVIALKFFVDSKVDYAVLEVGLGGRLDATNIVRPNLTVLTRIELEHLGVLGSNLEEILDEKLGIVKNGVPLVVGVQKSETRMLIDEKLKGKPDLYFVEGETGSAWADNGRLVFMALRVLLGNVDYDVFDKVYDSLHLLGRFDTRLIDGKKVIFDMAHTVASMNNLVESLKDLRPSGTEFVFLFSMLKGKDLKGVFAVIAPMAARIVFCSCHPERGMSGAELAEKFEGFADANLKLVVEVEENANLAYSDLLKDLKKDQVLVVTGSHFLIGEILRQLKP